jgi:hypothetical protein
MVDEISDIRPISIAYVFDGTHRLSGGRLNAVDLEANFTGRLRRLFSQRLYLGG